ncbi:MAG: site-specific integrase, partial [Chloroflexia bacterium]|nr:site-specific integrase [Chloroflexia bacterium]
WEDVNLDDGLVHVRGQLQWIDGKPRITPTKTTRSRRTIPLPAVTIDALRQHRVRQLEERLMLGGEWNDHGLVFTTSLGTPLDARNVRRWFTRLLEDANLPVLRFHDLRHSCATLLLAQGVAPRLIMETLGHSQISLTMNCYAHVLPTMQRESASLMDAILTATEG